MKKPKTTVAGVDEAGRGALAGPVVAAACVLPANVRVPRFIRDSKALTPKQRDEAYEWISKHCLFGVGKRTAKFIDAKRILAATEGAMQDAVKALLVQTKTDELLVDGRDKFSFSVPHTSIIRGDATEACISAASIVAKVTRDRLMIAYAKTFPQYGFEKHKGYGSASHVKALRQHGLSTLHRQTFIHLR